MRIMAEPSFNLLDTDFCDCFDLFSKDFEFKEHKENVQENEDCKNVTQTESESASSGSVGRFPQIKEEKLCFYEKNCQASKTKKNTKWRLKIFQGK